MQLISIQILRAVAATSVAVGHAQAFIGANADKAGVGFERSHLLPWGAGVDLFFVISGFIMVVSSERLFATPGATGMFLKRRLLRIVPLYWAAMALMLAKTVAQGRPLPDIASTLSSFLFLPWDALGKGEARPIYELGWTLNYEMFFYAVFALCLGFRREIAVGIAALALSMLVLIGLVAPLPTLQLATWAQPIILEFVLGMGIALAYRRGLRLGSGLRWTLVGFGIAMLLIDVLDTLAHPADWVTPNDLLRVAGWGLPAAAIVAGLALAPQSGRAAGRFARAGAALGDASYALYLLHPMVMGLVAAAWFRLPVVGALPWTGLWVSVGLSALAALAVYRWFERPLLQAGLGGPAQGLATAQRA